jgi:RNA polymerase-binding protein DksA
MESIRAELEKKRRALSLEIQSTMGRTRDTSERTEMLKDPYGAASMMHDEEMTVDVVGRRVRQLAAINRALEDIDAGRYGICQDCGEAIVKARLRAMPFTTRCVRCQGELEGFRRAA